MNQNFRPMTKNVEMPMSPVFITNIDYPTLPLAYSSLK